MGLRRPSPQRILSVSLIPSTIRVFVYSLNKHKPWAAASLLGIGNTDRRKFTGGRGRLREGFLEDPTSEVKLVG